jgi:hypothetical protein
MTGKKINYSREEHMHRNGHKTRNMGEVSSETHLEGRRS